MLLPYDRAIGRFKKHDSLNGFGKIAQVKFATWLETDSGLAVQEQQTCVYVFSRVVEILEESRAAIRKGVRGDSRKVWLPLQYAVRQDECDTQAELDSLVERAVGDQFTNSNRLLLVDAQGFARALRGSVHDAQDYHVLWVHDYRGKNAAGDPDRIGFQQTPRIPAGDDRPSSLATIITGKLPPTSSCSTRTTTR